MGFYFNIRPSGMGCWFLSLFRLKRIQQLTYQIISMTLNVIRTEIVTDMFYEYILIIYTPQRDVRDTKKGRVLSDACGNFLRVSVLRHRIHVRSWKFPRHMKLQRQRGYIFQFPLAREYFSHVGIDWQERRIQKVLHSLYLGRKVTPPCDGCEQTVKIHPIPRHTLHVSIKLTDFHGP
jgi:hypothetical protein